MLFQDSLKFEASNFWSELFHLVLSVWVTQEWYIQQGNPPGRKKLTEIKRWSRCLTIFFILYQTHLNVRHGLYHIVSIDLWPILRFHEKTWWCSMPSSHDHTIESRRVTGPVSRDQRDRWSLHHLEGNQRRWFSNKWMVTLDIQGFVHSTRWCMTFWQIKPLNFGSVVSLPGQGQDFYLYESVAVHVTGPNAEKYESSLPSNEVCWSLAAAWYGWAGPNMASRSLNKVMSFFGVVLGQLLYNNRPFSFLVSQMPTKQRLRTHGVWGSLASFSSDLV